LRTEEGRKEERRKEEGKTKEEEGGREGGRIKKRKYLKLLVTRQFREFRKHVSRQITAHRHRLYS
jgi:hypothetical protein